MNDKLELRQGSWYAWQMLPGYRATFDPYNSPIKMREIRGLKTGRSVLFVSFLNLYYAQGVQIQSMEIRILGRAQNHLVAELISGSHQLARRHAVIGSLSREWLEIHGPRYPEGLDLPPDASQTQVFERMDYLARRHSY